jgi:hypothetical protein
MFVKPKSGLKVRDPDRKDYLPTEGREVPPSLYWTRRVRDGDVTNSTPQTQDTAPAASTPAQASKEPGK